MTDALTEMLATRDWLLADGATGTNLFNMGLQSGDAPGIGGMPTNRKRFARSIVARSKPGRTCS